MARRVRRELNKAAGDALVCSLHQAYVLHQFGAAQMQGKRLQCCSWLLAHDCLSTKGLDKLISIIEKI